MTLWQVLRQLRDVLRDATWPDAGGGTVFGGVVVTAAELGRVLSSTRLPAVILRPSGGTADEQEPRLLLERVEAVLVAAVPGDATGEGAILGGPRAGGSTTSAGRGLLELEEELLAAVGRVSGPSGVRLRATHRGRGAVELDAVHGHVATRGYVLEAWTTADRSYPAPANLVATPSGGGAVALTWVLPPDRYDRLEVVLRRASGATPPASATAGTGVTLANALATSVTDTPGAGTWSYALFAGYDETSSTPTTTGRWSSSVTRASVVAT